MQAPATLEAIPDLESASKRNFMKRAYRSAYRGVGESKSGKSVRSPAHPGAARSLLLQPANDLPRRRRGVSSISSTTTRRSRNTTLSPVGTAFPSRRLRRLELVPPQHDRDEVSVSLLHPQEPLILPVKPPSGTAARYRP